MRYALALVAILAAVPAFGQPQGFDRVRLSRTVNGTPSTPFVVALTDPAMACNASARRCQGTQHPDMPSQYPASPKQGRNEYGRCQKADSGHPCRNLPIPCSGNLDQASSRLGSSVATTHSSPSSPFCL